MQNKLVVAVLGGGTSTERAVSLKTAAAVQAALEAAGDVDPVACEILADGGWLWNGESVGPERWVAGLREVDACFVALHGGSGENGTVQGLLESLGVPYTGSGVAASALCMDKLQMRRVANACGLRLAPGAMLARATRPGCGIGGGAAAVLEQLGPKLVVKPRSGGSSVGVRVVSELASLTEAVAAIHAAGDDALAEAFVEGVEVTCGVLGNASELEALPLVEIRPHAGRFFDYEEKYSESGAEELCPPVSVSAAQCDNVKSLARLAHEELGCRGYSRSDFLLPAAGPPVFLETNTLPGLTPRSLLPQEAAAAGRTFPELCRQLVAFALEAGSSALASTRRGGLQ